MNILLSTTVLDSGELLFNDDGMAKGFGSDSDCEYLNLPVILYSSVILITFIFEAKGSLFIKLMKESRTEIRKVVWPTRMETTQTFMIVFGSIIVFCLFFWGLESLLSFLTSLVLG